MTKEDETIENATATKPKEAPAAAEPAEGQPPKVRKIVRRSGSTRENPAFTPTEAAAAPPADAAPSDAAPAASAPAASTGTGEAPAAAAPKAPEASAGRQRATYDARAPRQPRPAGDAGRPERRGPRPGGDFRPPEARPMGARPAPGGPRYPAGGGGGGGDYRPPPARPMGARPIPGGPRSPAPEWTRQPREEGAERPRRPERPVGERRPPQQGAPGARPPAAAPAKPAQEKAAAERAAPPKAKPVAAPPPAPSKPAAPAPKQGVRTVALPLTVPLPRAGGSAAGSAKPALTAKEAMSAKAKAAASSSKAKPTTKPEADAHGAAPALDPALLEAGWDDARDALRKAGDAGAALVEAWITASNAAAVAAIAEADDVQGAARKAARRGLNVLRARGVAIPTRQHVVRLADDRAEVSLEATLIPADSTGTMAVSITSRDASGRYHLAEVIIREPIGILQAGSGWLSGSQLKEGRTRALEGLGFAPVPVPVDWARWRIAAARKQNAESRQVVPLGLERCRELIEPLPEAAPAHPMAELEASLSAEKVAECAKESGQLHAEPEFASWLPDRASLDELLQNVGERLGPQGVRDPAKVNEALLAEVEAATDRFFSPEVRSLVERRMRDSAISVRARKGDQRATDVLAVARAVREAGLITSPPREIPFLVTFYRKALSVLMQQGGGQLRVPMRPDMIPAQEAPSADDPALEAPLADIPVPPEGG